MSCAFNAASPGWPWLFPPPDTWRSRSFDPIAPLYFSSSSLWYLLWLSPPSPQRLAVHVRSIQLPYFIFPFSPLVSALTVTSSSSETCRSCSFNPRLRCQEVGLSRVRVQHFDQVRIVLLNCLWSSKLGSFELSVCLFVLILISKHHKRKDIWWELMSDRRWDSIWNNNDNE